MGLVGAVALRALAPFPVHLTLGEEPSMLDRITASVVQHRLEAIVQEMGEAMLRTAYHGDNHSPDLTDGVTLVRRARQFLVNFG